MGLLAGCGSKTLDDHLLAARQFVEAQQFNAAIIEYKNAIQLEPDAATPRFELGRLYLEQQNYAGAEKELNRALELGHTASEVIPLLSVAYQQTGAETALIGMDHQASGMTAVQSAEVGFYKVQALAELGKDDQALDLIGELEQLDTSSVYKGLALSFKAIIAQNFELALSETQALREQAPSNKDVLLQMAKLQMLQRQLDPAIETYQGYIKLYPQDITSKFTLLALLMETRRLEEAEPYVDELLAINSEHGLLNQYKGLIDTASGRYADALSHFDLAIQNGQSNNLVRVLAGFSAYQLQDYATASRHLTMVASELPDNHAGLRMLADSLLQQGASEEAAAILNRMSGDLDADASLFSKAGFQLIREGNVADAKKMVQKSSQLSESAEELTRLGVLQLSLNDLDGLVNLEEAAAKAPESATTQKTLLAAYSATGQLDKAVQLAQQWHEQDPQNIDPMLHLAQLAMMEKQFDDASQWLEQAEGVSGPSTEIRLVQARLAFSQQQDDQGKALLEDILATNPSQVSALTMLYLYEAEKGQIQPVVKRAETVLSSEPDNLQLRLLVARMAFADKDYSKVLDTLKRVQQDASTPASYWSLKGQALLNLAKVNDAESHYDAWLAKYPQNKDAALGRLLIYDAKRQNDAAVQFTREFLAKRQDLQIQLLQAHFMAMQPDVQSSRAVLESLPEQVQQMPFARGIRGRLSLVEGDAKGALDDVKVAYEALPNGPNAILLVACYEASGQPDNGFEVLEQHIEDHPADVAPQLLYAQRLIPRDRSLAQAQYVSLLEKMPNDFVVLNNLAYLYFEQAQYQQAEPLARKAVSLQPSNPDAVDTLGQILIKQGKPAEAVSLYEGVITPQAGSEQVYLNYVELLLAQGKEALAKRRLTDREFTQPESRLRIESLKQSYAL